MQGCKKQTGWCYQTHLVTTRSEHWVPCPGMVTSPSSVWGAFLRRNPSSCPTWTSLANALRGLEVQNRADLTAAREPQKQQELQCWAVHPSHLHIPTSMPTTDFNRLGFPQQLLQMRISSSERKEVDYGKFMCPSVGDVTFWLQSAKSTEMFYNQIPNLQQSERVKSHMLCTKTPLLLHIFLPQHKE